MRAPMCVLCVCSEYALSNGILDDATTTHEDATFVVATLWETFVCISACFVFLMDATGSF